MGNRYFWFGGGGIGQEMYDRDLKLNKCGICKFKGEMLLSWDFVVGYLIFLVLVFYL